MTLSGAQLGRFVRSPSGRCLYHCSRPTRPRVIAGPKGSSGWVYTCPTGTVSTVVFLGGTRRLSPVRIRQYLNARMDRSERVLVRDLRAASRHGPELGRSAERRMTRGAGTVAHLLYWRRYPRKVGRRYSYLYACFRHGPGEVRFFPAGSNASRSPLCPFCAAKV